MNQISMTKLKYEVWEDNVILKQETPNCYNFEYFRYNGKMHRQTKFPRVEWDEEAGKLREHAVQTDE